MPLHPTWLDLAIRLALAFVASAAIGLNRGTRGRAAGLRTVLLVGLAACVAMILANVLLSQDGKTSQSFATLDPMRLPLGVLTGVGFIGGGAILKRGDIVSGLTTAATLWLTTVVGLCFGAGQIALAIVGAGLALTVLFLLAWVEARIPREHRARLEIRTDKAASPAELPSQVAAVGCQAHLERQTEDAEGRIRLCYELAWRRADVAGPPLDLLELINAHYQIVSFEVTTGAPL